MSSAVGLMIILAIMLCIQTIWQADAAGYSIQCPAPGDTTAIRRLKSSLFCDYDVQERPVRNRTANVTIQVLLNIQRVHIDDSDGNFLVTWLTMDWQDEYLKWNKEDFDNIEKIEVPASQIWLPDFTFYNSDLASPIIQGGTTRCILYSNGEVLCVPSIRAPMYCVHDAQRWPFDTRNCTLYLGSWLHHGAQVDLQIRKSDNEGYTTDSYVPNREWELLSIAVQKHTTIYACCPDDPYVHLEYNVALRRHAALHTAVMVVPAFVFVGVTLASFCTRHTTLRVLACLASLLGNTLFLLHLGQRLPADGDTRPLIVVYYRDAMVMTALALGIALFVGWMDEVRTPPRWAQNITIWLSGKVGPPVQLLLGNSYTEHKDTSPLENGNVAHEVASPTTSDSKRCPFAIMIDRLALLLFIITYGIFLSALLP